MKQEVRQVQKMWLIRILDRECPTCKAYKKKGPQNCSIFKAVHNVEPILYDNAKKIFNLEEEHCKGYKERES